MDEFLINTSTAGDAGQPSVAGFQGTQFVVVWEDRNLSSIKGQMFGTSGDKSGPEFFVNIPTEPGQPVPRRQLPAIVEYGAGFAVAWTEQAPGVPSTAPAQIKLRTFDQDTLSGPEIQVSSSPVEPLTRPAMARLSDGGFVVVWPDKRQDERIRAQRFAQDGTKNGPEFRANTTPGLHRVSLVTCLTNGNIVIAWRARLAPALQMRFQIFNATGPVGGERIAAPVTTAAAMTALDTGRFVIAHLDDHGEDATADTLIAVQADVYEANGAFSNIQLLSTPEQRIHATWPALVPLSGGRFVAAWAQLNVDNIAAGINVKARVFSAAGPVGQITQVNTSTGNQRFSLHAWATNGPAGETLFAAWADDSNPAGRAVRGRVLPIPAGGF